MKTSREVREWKQFCNTTDCIAAEPSWLLVTYTLIQYLKDDYTNVRKLFLKGLVVCFVKAQFIIIEMPFISVTLYYFVH